MFVSCSAGALDNDVEVPPKLQELHDSVCNIIIEYTVFLEVLASFLKNVREVRFVFFPLYFVVFCTRRLTDVRTKERNVGESLKSTCVRLRTRDLAQQDRH